MAAGPTYTPIATTTTSGNATSVTFSSISSAYTDLVLVYSAKFSGNRTTMNLNFNSDTGSNYSYTQLYGNGTTIASSRTTTYTTGYGGLISDQWQAVLLHFNNYSNTTTYKTVLVRGNNLGSTASEDVSATVNLWRSTSAISTIKLAPANGLYLIDGSMFTLYGILAA